MKYEKDDLKYFKMLPKKDRIKTIHFRITTEQNKLIIENLERKHRLKMIRQIFKRHWDAYHKHINQKLEIEVVL
jgi:hypothetical protein